MGLQVNEFGKENLEIDAIESIMVKGLERWESCQLKVEYQQ